MENTTNTGTPPPVEQVQQDTPPVVTEQTQTTPPPVAENTPQIPAEIKAQLDAANARIAELDKQTRYHQSRADQANNQVRALAGLAPQTPPDPLAPYLEKYKAYEPETAKVFAELEYKNDQRYSKLQSAMQMQGQMGTLMDEAFTMAPAYLADPEVNRRVQLTAAEYAKNGEQLTAAHLAEMAAVAHMYVTRERSNNGNATPPPQPPPQFNRGMLGVGSTYAGQAPVAQNPNAIPAHLKALQQSTAAEIQSRYKLPTSQS